MSLNRLTFFELSQKVWDDSIQHQDILDEAGLRFKKGEIKDSQLINLMVTMRNTVLLNFPIKLKHDLDTLTMREHLFKQLRSRLTGGGAFYWSGSRESGNQYFVSLVEDIAEIDLKDMTQYKDIQDRAISSLAKVYYFRDSAAERVKDIAESYLDLPSNKKVAEENHKKRHRLTMFKKQKIADEELVNSAFGKGSHYYKSSL
jgi:hypothetical protein